MKVLIVDDDESGRLYLKSILQTMGHATQECTNGEAALEILSSPASPQLAIMDWMMPGMSGIELCRRLRTNSLLPFVYSILVTSRNRKEDILEVLRAGANDYIQKPFKINEINPRIEFAIRNIELNELVQKQKLSLISTSKMATLGEMAAGLAHEINNPLAIIQGNAELLKDTVKSDRIYGEDYGEICDRITVATTRVAKIIKGLRFFARNGDNDPLTVCNITTILEDTLSLCRERFKSRGIQLRMLDIEPELQLECRATQISQVLLNLLNNSFDTIQNHPSPWIEISVRDLGSSLEIRITDSGPGIPAEVAERIMQPFFTTKGVQKGMGMGLSVATGIAKAHQGVLFLDQTSKNTSFVLRLSKTNT